MAIGSEYKWDVFLLVPRGEWTNRDKGLFKKEKMFILQINYLLARSDLT